MVIAMGIMSTYDPGAMPATSSLLPFQSSRCLDDSSSHCILSPTARLLSPLCGLLSRVHDCIRVPRLPRTFHFFGKMGKLKKTVCTFQ
jgi:hypothetical protein